MADSSSKESAHGTQGNGDDLAKSRVERLHNAEVAILERLEKAPELESVGLVEEISDIVKDRSIASLALWELLDRGKVEFGAKSRERLRLVTSVASNGQ